MPHHESRFEASLSTQEDVEGNDDKTPITYTAVCAKSAVDRKQLNNIEHKTLKYSYCINVPALILAIIREESNLKLPIILREHYYPVQSVFLPQGEQFYNKNNKRNIAK